MHRVKIYKINDYSIKRKKQKNSPKYLDNQYVSFPRRPKKKKKQRYRGSEKQTWPN